MQIVHRLLSFLTINHVTERSLRPPFHQTYYVAESSTEQAEGVAEDIDDKTAGRNESSRCSVQLEPPDQESVSAIREGEATPRYRTTRDSRGHCIHHCRCSTLETRLQHASEASVGKVARVCEAWDGIRAQTLAGFSHCQKRWYVAVALTESNIDFRYG